MEQLKEKSVFITAKDVKNALNGKTYGENGQMLLAYLGRVNLQVTRPPLEG